MKKEEIIRKIFAFVLLLVFTFSATPKKYLHDLVATHTDYSASHSGDKATVTTAGFNCHCDNLVVSTPFIQATFSIDFPAPTFYAEFIAASYRQFILTTQYTKDLRGPPAVA